MQYEQVKELIAIFEKTDLNDMELTLDNMSIRLNRSRPSTVGAVPAYGAPIPVAQPQIPAAAAPAIPAVAEAAQAPVAETEEAADDKEKKEGTIVKAPIVGTFYASPEPDKPPYVKVGDTVAQGDILCIIEAMKFMNEVPSEAGGKIAEIFVKDGDFVEFGQELFRIV